MYKPHLFKVSSLHSPNFGPGFPGPIFLRIVSFIRVFPYKIKTTDKSS